MNIKYIGVKPLIQVKSFCTLVRKRRGRVWYRSDSTSIGDLQFVADCAIWCGNEYPQFDWAVGDASESRNIAPSEITREWDSA